ncbi:beta-lactamase family protein [Roseibacterium beibuensis]|uniref:serine hydrolase domain-containing protein n=1 Tax=[Roseibacterium] beibuensis TaxID=1193142 RepID=UPI00217E1C58|nr:serine hydrolase domain-containing protein [Roseibacterium beibuensis]MCS6627416.1 beta-lactamase family protein [Roseibacterium beibuensis]
MIKSASAASLLVAAALSIAVAPARAGVHDAFFAAVGEGSPERPGCAVGVVENGQLTASRYFGLADIASGEPIGPTTRFNIASISKQFTAGAVALLVAEGRLSEDDPVRRHIPELPERFGDLTVRHLLGHQSGLRNHMALISFSPPDETLSHRETVALVLRQGGSNSPPGQRFEYQSPSYVLLAEVVARVSGSSFEDFMETRLFAPLGMDHTGFGDQDLSQSYTAAGDGYEPAAVINLARGSSGVVTTLEDLARWLPVLEGKPVGGHDLSAPLQSWSVLPGGERIPYNYGVAKEEDAFGVPGLLRLSHGGYTAGYRTTVSLIPARHLGVIALCNASDAPIPRVDAAMAGLLGAGEDPRPAAAPTAPMEPPAAVSDPVNGLAGAYVDAATDGLREFVVKDGVLKLRYFGQAFPLVPQADGTFDIDGSRFRFSTTPEGQTVTEIADGADTTFVRVDRPPDDALPLGVFRSPDVNGPLRIRSDGGALIVSSERNSAHLRPIGGNMFTSDDGDYALVRYVPSVGGQAARLWVTTHSGIRALGFSQSAD